MTTTAEHVLIDHSLLLRDPDIVRRIHRKKGLPFVTYAALEELITRAKGNNQPDSGASLLNYFSNKNSRFHEKLPKGLVLKPGDLLAEFAFEGQSIFAIKRSAPLSTPQRAPLCVELSSHYDLLLLTDNKNLFPYCKALNVRAQLWTGPASPKKIMPFELPATPTTRPDSPIQITNVPREGHALISSSGRHIRLGKAISSGGEGSIYALPGGREVCKIYHAEKLTIRRQQKIELMVTRQIVEQGICWPTESVRNIEGQFVGYVMPMANGRTLQSSAFGKPMLAKAFPSWTRKDLVNIGIAFLKQVHYLHSLNIIIGDINPMNLLVTQESTRIWMVDTDSFQIEGFPCEVGTPNYTAPELQGQNYAVFLRTKDHELFAVATMLFMILLPGKPPYAQQGGGSQEENIKNRNFPYRYKKNSGKGKTSVTPKGAWQNIWSHLPYTLKQAFGNTFEDNQRTQIDKWLEQLNLYATALDQNKSSNALFPDAFHISDPVETICGSCKKTYIESKKWVLTRKSTRCSQCQRRANVEEMARESQKEIERAQQRPPPPTITIAAPQHTKPTQPRAIQTIAPPIPRNPPSVSPAKVVIRQPQRHVTSPRPEPKKTIAKKPDSAKSVLFRLLNLLLKRFL
ncbi:hypothetical protein LRS56_21680 [Pseudomonas poae]|nr:hypothetical protein LRS56_21680 [Pseudomonas poae]